MSAELVIFGILALIAIVSAIMMLRSTNAVYSALWLVLNFSTIGVLYLILSAPFIAMVQITVYAGAIMVLFLFVIMLLGAERLGGVAGSQRWQMVLAGFLSIVLIGVFGIVMWNGTTGLETAVSTPVEITPQMLGLRLFEGYVFPFEVTGILLLTSMIGVVILNTKKKEGNKNG